MTPETNLPANPPEADAGLEPPPLERRQPLTVAFLPLALVTFVLLALTIAAWTFLAAGAGA
ncbi:MAG: hypothetical protein ACRDFY_03955 [Candidatus Limnocylindria bacterium]